MCTTLVKVEIIKHKKSIFKIKIAKVKIVSYGNGFS